MPTVHQLVCTPRGRRCVRELGSKFTSFEGLRMRVRVYHVPTALHWSGGRELTISRSTGQSYMCNVHVHVAISSWQS